MQLSRRWADIGQPLMTGFMGDQMVSDAASITGSQCKLGKNIDGLGLVLMFTSISSSDVSSVEFFFCG